MDHDAVRPGMAPAPRPSLSAAPRPALLSADPLESDNASSKHPPTQPRRRSTYSRPPADPVNLHRQDEKRAAVAESAIDVEIGHCVDQLEDDSRLSGVAARLMNASRYRRRAVLITAFAFLAILAWSQSLWPQTRSEPDIQPGLTMSIPEHSSVSHEKDPLKVHNIDPSLIPGGEADPQGERRLVFVGDVHGCKNELLQLLKLLEFREDLDHLILAGDIISKGPDNVGTLDELIRLKATSVRGNHEDRILHAVKSFSDMESTDTSAVTLDKKSAKDAALIRRLKPKHLDYLRSLPLILRIPPLPKAAKPSKKKTSPIAEEILVVHAGLVPAMPLEKQDDYMVMNMRSIDHKTHAPSAERSSKDSRNKPWVDIWNWYNDKLFRDRRSSSKSSNPSTSKLKKLWSWFGGSRGPEMHASKDHATPAPQVVIFGHDSKAGLQIHRWAKGLDSACVSGGQLTALVLDAKGHYELVSVDCKGYRK